MSNDLKNMLGKHLIYTYDNGWQYELYVKNDKTIDYRIHSGIVDNRWVKDQQVYLVKLASSTNIFKIPWTEPTGTSVSLAINLDERHLHGPTYPIEVIDEFAKITFIENCQLNDDTIVACEAKQLPDGYAKRKN